VSTGEARFKEDLTGKGLSVHQIVVRC